MVPDQLIPPQWYPWHDHMTQSMVPPLDVEVRLKIAMSIKKGAKLSCAIVLMVYPRETRSAKDFGQNEGGGGVNRKSIV